MIYGCFRNQAETAVFNKINNCYYLSELAIFILTNKIVCGILNSQSGYNKFIKHYKN